MYGYVGRRKTLSHAVSLQGGCKATESRDGQSRASRHTNYKRLASIRLRPSTTELVTLYKMLA